MTEVMNTRQRQNLKRVASDSVQGAGSWVEVKGLTLGESKRIAQETAEAGDDTAVQVALTERLIRDHLLNWSWVDDDGDPLPLPADDPSVMDLLTVEEITFLGGAISGLNNPK